MIRGLDVSVYQQPTPDLTGYDFLIARACYGTHPDATFAGHIAAAKAAGLVTGAYCFGRTVQDPHDQALELVQAADDAGVDFLVLDVESDGAQPEMTEAQCREFLDACRFMDDRQVWLYHSRSGFPPDAYGFDGRWVADYGMNTGEPGRPPAIPWDLWQYTSNPLDKNVFDGTRDELAARLGRPTVSPYFTVETSTTGLLVDVPVNASVFDAAEVSDAHLRRKCPTPETWLTVGWVVGTDGNRFMCRVGADGVFEFVLASEIGQPYEAKPAGPTPTPLAPGLYRVA